MSADFPTRQRDPDFPTQAPPQRRKTPWWIPPLVVAGLAAVYVLLSLLLPRWLPLDDLKLPSITTDDREPSVLLLALGSLPEWRQGSVAELFGAPPQATFRETLEALRIAQSDPSIKGAYLRLSLSSTGWAQREELIEALLEFRKSGKFVYAFMEAGDERDFMLAAAVDSIFMPPGGLLKLSGFSVSELFLTGLLEKLGISFHVEQFEEYKSAGEPFVRRSFSLAARRNLLELLQQRYRRFAALVEAQRKVAPSELQRLLSKGVHTPDSLRAAGLIDGVVHETELLISLARRIGLKDTLEMRERLLSVARYRDTKPWERWHKRAPSRPAIAIVYASGPIVPGRQSDPFSSPVIAAEDLIEALRKAERDKDIAAIILRVDSPGGSVLGSDAIWTELRRIAQHKPIYASLGPVAASGGYYLAMGCDTIIAHPTTITGSVGVILMLPNYSGTLRKLGITVDTVTSNDGALFADPSLPYPKAQLQRFRELGAEMYRLFLQKVAAQRNMSLEEVRERARGRVWSGEDAYRQRLVDTLGGLSVAINIAKRRLGIPPDQPVAIRDFPEPKDPLELLLEALRGGSSGSALSRLKEAFLELVPQQARTAAQHALQLQELSQREPLLLALPPEWLLLR
ncbi:MAG: signal peptide peptidase SppA [Chlorobiota bacterium]